MTVTLVVPSQIVDRFSVLVRQDFETGGVLLAHTVVAESGDVRLLATDLLEVPEDAYERREAQQLLIASEGYVPALARAEESGAMALWFHTHPGEDASPRASKHDKRVDEQLTDLFRMRADADYYGALIVSETSGRLRFTGHIDDGQTPMPIKRLWSVGPRLALLRNEESHAGELPALFDRNVRAFGGDIQHVLGDLDVALVGCGGTGSAVAEQLVRLGVRRFLLIDPDTLSESNLTRVYGSFPEDVGRPKVEVVGDHLRRIDGDVSVEALQATITDEVTARRLAHVDVVFGCTDDNAGRLVLSRLAYYLLTPVIDCGVLLSSDESGALTGIDGRVTVLYPGTACLVCRGRIDIARAGSEMLTADERTRLVGEGYAPALPGVEPAVVTFTSVVAATAVSELLERLSHYGDDPVPSEILLRLHDREISTNAQSPRDRHYCDATAMKFGLGDVSPFLEQTWRA